MFYSKLFDVLFQTAKSFRLNVKAFFYPGFSKPMHSPILLSTYTTVSESPHRQIIKLFTIFHLLIKKIFFVHHINILLRRTKQQKLRFNTNYTINEKNYIT